MNVERIAEVVEGLAPEQALDTVLAANENARVCLTSSFQAEDMAVLHLLRERIPDVPVLFLDTGYHFPQTYEYRDRMAKDWSLHLVNVLQRERSRNKSQHSAFSTRPIRHAAAVAQSRASSRRTGALRCLVHRIAARTVPDAQEPQKGRAAPFTHRQDPVESEPPRRLELGTGLELRECEWHQALASVRRGLSQHWMPALYRPAG